MSGALKQAQRRSRLSTRFGIAGAVGIATLVAGCNAHHQYRLSTPSLTYEQRHPIVIGFRPVGVNLYADPYEGGLNAVDKTEVAAVARQYRNNGYGPIWLQVPPPGVHDHAVQRSIHQVRSIVAREGVDGSVVQVRSYGNLAADPHGPAPLRLVFQRYAAEAGPCGEWPDNVAHDPDNEEYHNFGCAYQRAMAAQIADPRDLLGPRGHGERNSVRRADVFEKYQRGEVTSADLDDASQATVSDVAE
ncbi:MAG: CpaD family pilus assembly protein [Pseudomonadota bacterium]